MTDPTRLSPAAQAVLYAYEEKVGSTAAITSYERSGIAAVLRFAADQVAFNNLDDSRNNLPAALECECRRIRCELLAIAAELNSNHPILH